jgi:hypothetical protein
MSDWTVTFETEQGAQFTPYGPFARPIPAMAAFDSDTRPRGRKPRNFIDGCGEATFAWAHRVGDIHDDVESLARAFARWTPYDGWKLVDVIDA